MKVLYAIQGTGNGHISRAREIVPVLKKKADVDILISGTQVDLNFPFEVKYRLHGLSFIFGKNGGINMFSTLQTLKAGKLISDIKNFPAKNYDLIINDFEPISAWAARVRNIPCLALSHQAAVAGEKAPRPQYADIKGLFVLKHYAPANNKFGFHFESYDERTYTPIIRSDIKKAKIRKKNHYTVYLPAFGDDLIIKFLSGFPSIKWQVFSKHTRTSYSINNVSIKPVNYQLFVDSMVNCRGILCTAGFETPAEALYMGKKLMVIPMHGQYEQQCNAAALEKIGVPVIKRLNEKSKIVVAEWLNSMSKVSVDYPNQTEQIIDRVLEEV